MSIRLLIIWGFACSAGLFAIYCGMKPCWPRELILFLSGIIMGMSMGAWTWNGVVVLARGILKEYREKLEELDRMINEKKITGPF